MPDNIPFIADGVFNEYYHLTSNKKAVQSYFEVDLGELNYINTRFAYFNSSNDKAARETFSHLEKKMGEYYIQEGNTLPALPIIKDVGIKGYSTIDDVVRDHRILFLLLLKEGYYLNGTKVAHLYKSVIPLVDHLDFDFFFAAKLYYVSRNLSLIDPFLDFQLQRFQSADKTAIDFKRFLKLNVREYAIYFKLRKETIETVEEWLENLSHSDPNKKSDNGKRQNQKAEGWTKAIAILMRAILNEKFDTFVISKQVHTCEAFNILSGYSKKSLENHLSAADPHSYSPIQFSHDDFLKIRKYLKRIIHQVEVLESSIKD